MLVDARRVAFGEILEAEVCIIGAGPAGISMAREFNGQGLKAIVLETGGFEPDAKAQALAEDVGFPIGDFYVRTTHTRERQYGGTANNWQVVMENGRPGARYVPLDPIDFEKRDWLPYSGWPITRQDLDPYYEKAHKVCQSGPYTYRPEDWGDDSAQPFPFNSSRITTQLFQFGPADAFLQDYRQELEQSSNVTLCTYATALELETDNLAQTVTRVRVGTLEGNQFWVNAKMVILATGALEAARLLLLSNGVQRNGLGNGYDLVGRFLMDHQAVRSGLLVPQHRRVINALSLYDMRFVKGKLVTAKAVLSETTMRQEKLMNICAAFYPRPKSAEFNLLRMLLPKGKRYRSLAVESALAMKQALGQGKLPPKLLKHLATVANGLDDLLYFQWRKGYTTRAAKTFHFDRGGWSAQANKVEAFSCFEVIHMTEQSPDPRNRLVLTSERDALGCRKPQLYWRMNDLDFDTIRRAQAIFKEEFTQAGLGQLNIETDHGLPYMVSPSIHHSSGTTRMHDSPTQGVVDANCKVHGVSNLFIASSSVFPTVGYANPTLTIIAIALRVAEHVKQELEQPSVVLV